MTSDACQQFALARSWLKRNARARLAEASVPSLRQLIIRALSNLRLRLPSPDRIVRRVGV
jgi:hypothetical protein